VRHWLLPQDLLLLNCHLLKHCLLCGKGRLLHMQVFPLASTNEAVWEGEDPEEEEDHEIPEHQKGPHEEQGQNASAPR
jgi:hypothetical protein